MLRPFADRLCEVRLVAGAPSYAALKKLDPFLPSSTVSDVLSARTNPRADFVMAFVRACRKHADDTHTPIADPALFDEQAWRDDWMRLQRDLRQCRNRGRPATERPADSCAPAACALPPDVTAFTGRGAQLAALDGLLDSSATTDDVPVVVIDGLFGMGKSALAVHWAHGVKDCLDDVVLLDLGEYGSAPTTEQVLTALLLALGVAHGETTNEIELAAAYRARTDGRRMLLILDDTDDLQQACALAPSGAGSMVIVTSRHDPSTRTVPRPVRRMSLPPLPAADARGLLTRLQGEHDGCTPQEMNRAVAICGGLPLALRAIADRAIRLPDEPLDVIADAVREGTPCLAHGTSPGRPTASPWLVFARQHDELPPAAQAALRLLGLQPTTEFDLHAAAALLGTPVDEAARELAVLASAHLVERVAAGRYRLPELVAVYAAKCCRLKEDEGTRDAAVRRLLHWYLRTAELAGRLLTSGRPRVHDAPVTSGVTLRTHDEAVRWCEMEQFNLRAATELAVSIGDHVTAWRLPYEVAPHFSLHHPCWTDVYRSAADCALSAGDIAGRAHSLNCLGTAYLTARQFAPAERCFDEALRLFSVLGDLRGEALVLGSLGETAGGRGWHRVALTWYQRAQEVALRTGDDGMLCTSLRHLAEASLDLGLDVPAFEYAERSLAVSSRLADDHGRGRSYVALARLYGGMGLHLTAIKTFQLAIAAMRQAGDQQGVTDALDRLCHLLQSLGGAGQAS